MSMDWKHLFQTYLNIPAFRLPPQSSDELLLRVANHDIGQLVVDHGHGVCQIILLSVTTKTYFKNKELLYFD